MGWGPCIPFDLCRRPSDRDVGRDLVSRSIFNPRRFGLVPVTPNWASAEIERSTRLLPTVPGRGFPYEDIGRDLVSCLLSQTVSGDARARTLQRGGAWSTRFLISSGGADMTGRHYSPLTTHLRDRPPFTTLLLLAALLGCGLPGRTQAPPSAKRTVRIPMVTG